MRAGIADLVLQQERDAHPQRTAEENWSDFCALRDRMKTERPEGQDCAYGKGHKLVCFDQNKSKGQGVVVCNIYEAVILRVRAPDEKRGSGDEDPRYYLHFLGYSKRQDRWERPSRFVPLTPESRALMESMHNQWDNTAKKAATTRSLPGAVGRAYGSCLAEAVPGFLAGSCALPGQLALQAGIEQQAGGCVVR